MYDLSWYNTLNQPFLNPPSWIFPPMWIFLYLTMAVAFIIFAITPYEERKTLGYTLFFSQLFVNLCWSPMFFIMKNIGFALIILIILDILVFLTIKEFRRISVFSGNLLIPYFIWIIFATYLNIGFLVLN